MDYVHGNSVKVFQLTLADGATGYGSFDMQIAGGCTLPIGVLVENCVECLAKDTAVPLWHGGSKAAGDIIKGNVLKGKNPNGLFAPQEVVATRNSTQPCVRVHTPASSFTCSATHRLVLPDGSETVGGQLRAGKFALTGEIEPSVHVAQVDEAGMQPVCSWTCKPDHNFFAAGSCTTTST